MKSIIINKIIKSAKKDLVRTIFSLIGQDNGDVFIEF